MCVTVIMEKWHQCEKYKRNNPEGPRQICVYTTSLSIPKFVTSFEPNAVSVARNVNFRWN